MSQIDDLRQWRHSAFEAHLYSTAELLGDKILAMTGHPEDAFRLAEAYYAMGEFLRGAKLIVSNSFESESPKCKYIAALCYVKAQELDAALDLLLKDPPPTPGPAGPTGSAGSSSIHSAGIFSTGIHSAPVPQNPSTSFAGPDTSVVHAPASGLVVPAPLFSGSGNHGARVLSTSSLKTGAGMRTVSGSSRVSMILPDFEGDNSAGTSLSGHAMVSEINGISTDSLLQFILGEVYTLQSKFSQSKEAYIAALRLDPRCYEAFDQLVKRHALMPAEERALLRSLTFSAGENEFARSIYALRLSTISSQQDLDEAIDTLTETYEIGAENVDILAARADTAYARSQFKQARELYERILKHDPHMLRVYANYVSTLYELREHNLLYKIVHELAADAPEDAVTFYAIGVYYMGTNNIGEARRHFSKASIANPSFAPSWLAFANTFAMEAEHEQAITAFGTAARLFPRFYLPYVYMGMQHFQLSNLGLAEKYLLTAADLYDGDPMLLNELGVVFYHQNDLAKAHTALELALQLAEKFDIEPRIWVSIKGNLGFVFRKMDKLNKALECFDDVCRHASLDANILSAMGLCYMQLGDLERATQLLTQALAISRDDPIANDLIKRAVKESADSFDVQQFVHANSRFMVKRGIELDFSKK